MRAQIYVVTESSRPAERGRWGYSRLRGSWDFTASSTFLPCSRPQKVCLCPFLPPHPLEVSTCLYVVQHPAEVSSYRDIGGLPRNQNTCFNVYFIISKTTMYTTCMYMMRNKTKQEQQQTFLISGCPSLDKNYSSVLHFAAKNKITHICFQIQILQQQCNMTQHM